MVLGLLPDDCASARPDGMMSAWGRVHTLGQKRQSHFTVSRPKIISGRNGGRPRRRQLRRKQWPDRSVLPANQLYPRSSQNPPGKRLVTNIAVIHFGFLNPSLVGMRSLSG